jgi:hypothetical protein
LSARRRSEAAPVFLLSFGNSSTRATNSDFVPILFGNSFLWEKTLDVLGGFGSTSPPHHCGIPWIAITMYYLSDLVQSECAPSPSGDWWRKRGARDYEQDYYRAQNYLLSVNPEI